MLTGPNIVPSHPTKPSSGHWMFRRSLIYTYCAPALKVTGGSKAREQDHAQIARPHIHQETRPGSGIFVTQCCKNPTRRPYDETGPHGFCVAEHRLGGNEDPRADDGAHDNADAAEQAHLGYGGRRELVLRQIQLRWPALPLPASLGCGQHSPKEALSQALSPVLLQESHQAAAPGALLTLSPLIPTTTSRVRNIVSYPFYRREHGGTERQTWYKSHTPALPLLP